MGFVNSVGSPFDEVTNQRRLLQHMPPFTETHAVFGASPAEKRITANRGRASVKRLQLSKLAMCVGAPGFGLAVGGVSAMLRRGDREKRCTMRSLQGGNGREPRTFLTRTPEARRIRRSAVALLETPSARFSLIGAFCGDFWRCR